MNKYLIQFLVSICFLSIFSLYNSSSVLIQTNSFKDNIVVGDFSKVQEDIDQILKKASLINPAFNPFQNQIKEELKSILNNWETFLVFTTKNEILLKDSDLYKINIVYLNFVEEILSDVDSLLFSVSEIQNLILNPSYKFQDNYLINTKLYDSLDNLQKRINEIKNHLKLIQSLAGMKKQNSILVLLQNDYEPRATGGFTSAVLDIQIFNGRIKNIQLIDVYDLDGQLIPDLKPPQEFADFNSKLFIRDSNFDPDFRSSALLVDRQIQRAISKSFDFIASVNLSFLNEIIKEPIDLKYQYSLLDKSLLTSSIKNHIQIILKEILKSPELLKKSFRQRDIQLTAKDKNIDQILKQNDFYHNLNPNITTISKANVNGYKSFFSQRSTLQIVVDHSKKNVTKTIKISSKHPYSNENQIYLESIFKQLGLNQKHDLFAGLKKEIKNFYRIYLPKAEMFNDSQNEYVLLEEILNPQQEKSNLEYSYTTNKAQFDFNEQVEVIGYKHFDDIQLIVILPSNKELFSPLFEYKKIKENTYEIPFDSEFLVIDK